ncbi:acyl carrier protein phosphodiesterase [Echinicola pacifica]|uniref:acyl carrier protein phosphodiesterase n=1 Tax=Echinicola pacifica TaxID=346377 RepID=UPI00035F8FB3
MNFLAHAYLSFDQPKVLLGNLIGDFVRGPLKEHYEKNIVVGIRLHRAIDKFTDSHLQVKEAQKLLKPTYQRYSLVITDVYFDYFLSKYWADYDHRSIEEYAQWVYDTVDQNAELLPQNFLYMFHYMKTDNWLVQYGTIPGMKASLTGISKHTTFDSKMETAHLFLQENEAELKHYFDLFFPDLIAFSKSKVEELSKNYDSL